MIFGIWDLFIWNLGFVYFGIWDLSILEFKKMKFFYAFCNMVTLPSSLKYQLTKNQDCQCIN